MKHDVVLVRFQEMPGLLLEAGEIGLADLRQFVFDAFADLVGEIRIDDRLSRLLDVLDKIAQPQPHQFEQRHGDAFPPLIGLNFLDQHRLLRDRGNAGLVFQRGSDLKQLLFQGVEALGALQQRQLQREHQEVEALGLLGAEASFRRQRRDLVDQFLALLVVDRDPCFRLAIFLDGAAMLADDEIVEIQAGDGVLQCLQRAGADFRLARRRLSASLPT